MKGGILDHAPTRSFRVLLGILLVVISYLAVTPTHYSILESVWDKAKHAAAFVALALATDFSFPDRKFNLAKVLPLIGYGMLIEITQHFLPFRRFEWLDIVSDAVGLLIYGVSLPLLRRLPVLRDRWR